MTSENDNPKLINVQMWGVGSDGKLYPMEKTTQEETSYFLSMATKGSTRVGDVPTGKQLRVRTILFTNATKHKKLWLNNGSGLSYTKLTLGVASSTSQVSLTDLKGIVFDSDIYIVASSFSAGMSIMVAGELDPKESATE